MPEDPVKINSNVETVSDEHPMMEFKNNWELLRFLFHLIRDNKKWWLLPLLFVLGFLGMFVSLTGNSSVLPAIYALF